jgi:type IV pilus assembly protein PilM
MALVGKPGGGPTLGLDIGTGFIKAVEVRPSRRGPVVTALGIAPTPPGSFSGDVIADPKALGATIRQLLRDSGISTKRCVSAVSGQSSFVIRTIELPKMTEKELKETMRFEIDRQIPFPATDVVMSYAPLTRGDEPPDAQNMTVLLAVGQQHLIRAHVETLWEAGLKPVAIDVEPLASARALLLDGYMDLTVAVVNAGAAKTDVAIFERGLLVLPRMVFVAGDSLTRAITDATGQPAEQAERLKRMYGEVQSGSLGGGSAFADMGSEPGAFAEPTSSFMPPEEEPGPFGGRSFDMDEEDARPSPTVRFSLDDDEPSPSRPTLDLSAEQDEEPQAPQQPAVRFDPGAPPPPRRETVLSRIAADDEIRRKVGEAVAPVVGELVMELRRSVDFYRTKTQGGQVDRVLLCGGTACLKGLAGAMEEELGVPVEMVDLAKRFQLASKSISPGYYSEVSPVLPVGIGLAIRDMVETGGPVSGRRKR